MLNLAETRIGKSFHRTVATGQEITQEGTPLVYIREGETTVVRAAVNGTTGSWAGVALSRNNSLTRSVAMEEAVIPAGLTATLQNTPVGAFRVEINGTLAAPGAPAAGEYSINGKVLTFNVADVGATVNVSYAYTPNVIQALAKTGSAPGGGLPSSALGVIGVIEEGDISTDMFDPAVDWSAGTILKVYAKDGLFTSASAGALEVPGAVVLRAPVAGNPTLTISLR